MKKKVLSSLLVLTMVAGMLAGCGESGNGGGTQGSSGGSSSGGQEADVSISDDGKVLNIYCWNEEFKSRVAAHYPGYEEVDATHGKIGDV